MLTKQDKIFIIETVRTEVKAEVKNEVEPFFLQLSKEFKDHTTALREDFSDQVKMLAELIQDRPTRGEVKDMIDGAIHTHRLLDH